MRLECPQLLLDELADRLVRAERALGVELGPPRRVLLHHADLLDRRAVERKELFDAHPVAVAGHREVARSVLAAIVNRENLALEILQTSLVAFPDADGDADGVTGLELGEILVGKLGGLLGVDLV